jgi:hypothetical protein
MYTAHIQKEVISENQILDKRNVFLHIKPVFVKRDIGGASNSSRDIKLFNSFPIIRLSIYNPKIRRVRYNSPKSTKCMIFYFVSPCVNIGEYELAVQLLMFMISHRKTSMYSCKQQQQQD